MWWLANCCVITTPLDFSWTCNVIAATWHFLHLVSFCDSVHGAFLTFLRVSFVVGASTSENCATTTWNWLLMTHAFSSSACDFDVFSVQIENLTYLDIRLDYCLAQNTNNQNTTSSQQMNIMKPLAAIGWGPLARVLPSGNEARGQRKKRLLPCCTGFLSSNVFLWALAIHLGHSNSWSRAARVT